MLMVTLILILLVALTIPNTVVIVMIGRAKIAVENSCKRKTVKTSSYPNRLKREIMQNLQKMALTIGKMYEEMGMHQKSIDLFDEALAIWHCDPNRDTKTSSQIGGYTPDEINAFSVTDLECICQLLIAKGRIEGTFHTLGHTGQSKAANAWLEALEIYENAPARSKLQDRSFLFPIFSGIFVFLKGGRIEQDEECTFEQNLGHKFIRETKAQGDPIHYSRALAMLCETKARLGQFNVALETFESLQEIYDPRIHSEGVSAAYGTDRNAQALSQSALWHLQLGNNKAALTTCDYVLTELVPLMDPKNILNMAELLLPIIYVYKIRGEQLDRIRDLFDRHVVQNFQKNSGKEGLVTPCQPLFKPMSFLLEACCCNDPIGLPSLAETVDWLLEHESKEAFTFGMLLNMIRCRLIQSITFQAKAS